MRVTAAQMFVRLTRQKIYVNLLLLCVGVYPKCFYQGCFALICADVTLFFFIQGFRMPLGLSDILTAAGHACVLQRVQNRQNYSCNSIVLHSV